MGDTTTTPVQLFSFLPVSYWTVRIPSQEKTANLWGNLDCLSLICSQKSTVVLVRRCGTLTVFYSADLRSIIQFTTSWQSTVRKVSQLKGLKSTPGGKLYRMLTHYSHLLVFFPLGQSYPDPLVGAPCVFLQRITELSSLEGETLRQEKSKKRKSKKTSWQSPSSESQRSRIKTCESVPTADRSESFGEACSFQWLLLIACLSSLIVIGCLSWLVLTFWGSWWCFNGLNGHHLLWQKQMMHVFQHKDIFNGCYGLCHT